jgi:hypothetical protein
MGVVLGIITSAPYQQILAVFDPDPWGMRAKDVCLVLASASPEGVVAVRAEGSTWPSLPTAGRTRAPEAFDGDDRQAPVDGWSMIEGTLDESDPILPGLLKRPRSWRDRVTAATFVDRSRVYLS